MRNMNIKHLNGMLGHIHMIAGNRGHRYAVWMTMLAYMNDRLLTAELDEEYTRGPERAGLVIG